MGACITMGISGYCNLSSRKEIRSGWKHSGKPSVLLIHCGYFPVGLVLLVYGSRLLTRFLVTLFLPLNLSLTVFYNIFLKTCGVILYVDSSMVTDVFVKMLGSPGIRDILL